MDKLKFISDQMDAIAVPYAYETWKKKVQYPYSVGEITEDVPETEDGAETSTMRIDVFHRSPEGALLALEQIKEKVKKHFHPIYGLRGQTDSGAIAVFYGGALNVPTGEADLKRIEITLYIKEWKGAI
jgi:hypothetical protein